MSAIEQIGSERIVAILSEAQLLATGGITGANAGDFLAARAFTTTERQ